MTTPSLLDSPKPTSFDPNYTREPNSVKENGNSIETAPASQTEPKKTLLGRAWPMLLLAVLAAGFLLGRFLFPASESHSPILEMTPRSAGAGTAMDKGVVVTVEPVTSRAVERSVQAVGTLNGFEELTISSKLEGRVVRIHYDLASVVKPGDLLLELDTTDAELTVQQSERSLQAELAKWGFASVPEEGVDVTQLPTVVTAKLRWDLAQSRLQRMLPLQSTNSITADDLEQAKSEARVTETEYRNQLLLARSAASTARLKAADLEIARQRLKDCQIRVPTPSNVQREEDSFYTISERLVSEGTLLRPGTEVFRLVLGRSLKLRLSIPQSYASQVCLEQSVAISISADPSVHRGIVKKISPSIDRTTRTFMVEVDVPNSDGRLKPGGFARASILIGSAQNAITVPLASVYSLAGIQKIFLFENGVAREHRVALGEQTNEWVEIASPPIPADAKVITSGQRMLSDGVSVQERAVAPAAAAGSAPPVASEEPK